MKSRIRPRRILLFLGLILLLLIARPIGTLFQTYYSDKKPVNTSRFGYTNDASNLNEVKIERVVTVSNDEKEAATQIAELVKTAALQGKKISIAGARHSMGGHTIYENGILLDMKGFNYMKLDTVNNLLLVGAGAFWSEVIPYLDSFNRSVIVMQSNNSFSVGGSISVNCHGWQANSPPIASTVQSLRLINAEGALITCNRDQNPQLFSLVLGGYGLFGVILDVQLKVTRNNMYKAQQYVIKSTEYVKEFRQLLKNAEIEMAYGRINVNPDNFMNEAILAAFIPEKSAQLQPLQKSSYIAIRRTVFRNSANSGYGKDLRWKAEKLVTSQISGKRFSRNQLLNEGVEIFQNTDSSYTDILHEYFIPEDSVTSFIKAVQAIIPTYKVDLLNITIRNVMKDEDTFLRYANGEVFGFVMLFNQRRSQEAEAEMKKLTQRLVDIAITRKGTFYLPYRLHANKDQVYKAYPKAAQFFSLKHKYDSLEIFQNSFYKLYK